MCLSGRLDKGFKPEATNVEVDGLLTQANQIPDDVASGLQQCVSSHALIIPGCLLCVGRKQECLNVQTLFAKVCLPFNVSA